MTISLETKGMIFSTGGVVALAATSIATVALAIALLMKTREPRPVVLVPGLDRPRVVVYEQHSRDGPNPLAPFPAREGGTVRPLLAEDGVACLDGLRRGVGQAGLLLEVGRELVVDRLGQVRERFMRRGRRNDDHVRLPVDRARNLNLLAYIDWRILQKAHAGGYAASTPAKGRFVGAGAGPTPPAEAFQTASKIFRGPKAPVSPCYGERDGN